MGRRSQPEIGWLTGHAVNTAAVRDRFWRIYTEPEKNEAKREPANSQSMGGRGLCEAEKRELVKSLRTEHRHGVVWVPERARQ